MNFFSIFVTSTILLGSITCFAQEDLRVVELSKDESISPNVSSAQMATLETLRKAKSKSVEQEDVKGAEEPQNASRVRITVTGHWPLNGSHEFGGAGLDCKDLLGPGEHFPSGVTCKDI